MGKFQSRCPHCGETFKTSNVLSGQRILCPACKKAFDVPDLDPVLHASPPSPPGPATKDCPFCGEQILAKARKCKHCGEILDPSLKREREAESLKESHSPEKVVVHQKKEGCFLQTLNLGCGILFILLALGVILFFYALTL